MVPRERARLLRRAYISRSVTFNSGFQALYLSWRLRDEIPRILQASFKSHQPLRLYTTAETHIYNVQKVRCNYFSQHWYVVN
jgi:hypothetical protein